MYNTMSIKSKYIWINGKIIPFAKAQIHVLNHGLHYGSAAFEGIRCYSTAKGPAVFRLREHIDRLFHSAAVMGMKIAYSKEDIIKAIKELIKKNSLKECYVRPIVYYGEKMGLNPAGAPLNIVIAAWEWAKYLTKDSVSVQISPFMRIHPASSKMTAKLSGHYANSIVASLQAKKKGFDEALLLDYQGNIAEGPGENIFFVKGKTFFTPRKDSILPGITRESIIKIARGLGFKVLEKNIKPKELRKFDEAFFTGTAVEVNAIGKIDKIIFNKEKEGPAAKQIKREYLKIVRGENKKYDSWLDYVK